MKRIAAPKWWPIERKIKKFIAVPIGPHPREKSLPLIVLLRDALKIVETGKEAERIIRKGEVLVDGRKMKNPNYGVGVFDVIEIPILKKVWRAIPRDGLTFIEIEDKEKKIKICKIVNKKTLKGNRNQLNLNDGRNLIADGKYSTQDSVVIEIPGQKIVEHLKFDKDSTAMIIGGKNEGIVSKVKKIEKERAWVGGEKTFEVPKTLLIVVGKDKPAIKLE